MAEAASANTPPGTPEIKKRDMLTLLTGSTVAIGVAALAWPLIDSMSPASDVLALASLEVDLSSIQDGQAITVVDTDAGRLGVGICYDIRFPELAALCAQRGAQLVDVGEHLRDGGEERRRDLAIELAVRVERAGQDRRLEPGIGNLDAGEGKREHALRPVRNARRAAGAG